MRKNLLAYSASFAKNAAFIMELSKPEARAGNYL